MNNYELIHMDTCLPDYWGGHHLPTVQILVDSTTTYQEVLDSLQDWSCYDHIEGVRDDMFIQAVEHMFSTVPKGDMGKTFAPGLDPDREEDYEDTPSVYAFFTLNMHDTPEELEEYAAELEGQLEYAYEQDQNSAEVATILAMMDEDARLLPYDKLVEVQMYNYPNSKILTEDQVWMYIEHLPPTSRAKKICLMTMESAAQCKTNKVYYLLNNKSGHMGVRYGVQGKQYISGFSFGRGHDGE